ncbi:hypothetical protein [Maribacter sp. 2307ULW6-5]|uniref:hypothetical protein n=1 Tax=Maribacter sp. 2307ULW6-5 TaxID=3386275 RepID=UPI0039BD3AA9
MKGFALGCMGLLLVACSQFGNKERRTQELVRDRLQEIDWNSVDAYPLFYTCDEAAGKPQQKSCFEETLVRHFKETLQTFEFTLEQGVDPEVTVIFVVNTEGNIIVKGMEMDPKLLKKMPSFQGMVSQSLKNLPALAPALKQGMPVSTKYRIPIQLVPK